MIDYLQIVTEEVMEMSHVLLLQFSLLGYYSTHMINSKWSLATIFFHQMCADSAGEIF